MQRRRRRRRLSITSGRTCPDCRQARHHSPAQILSAQGVNIQHPHCCPERVQAKGTVRAKPELCTHHFTGTLSIFLFLQQARMWPYLDSNFTPHRHARSKFALHTHFPFAATAGIVPFWPSARSDLANPAYRSKSSLQSSPHT